MAYYKISSSCLANLDHGEHCNCEREEEKISFFIKRVAYQSKQNICFVTWMQKQRFIRKIGQWKKRVPDSKNQSTLTTRFHCTKFCFINQEVFYKFLDKVKEVDYCSHSS